MYPVGNDNRLKFFVIVVVVRTMNGHWAQGAVGILRAVVAMIPGGTILPHFEFVLHRLALGSRALSNTIDAVHVILIQHPKAMPVDSGSILWQIVLDVYDEAINVRLIRALLGGCLLTHVSPQQASISGPGKILLKSFASGLMVPSASQAICDRFRLMTLSRPAGAFFS